MNLKDRVSLFENELSFFINGSIRDFAVFCLDKLPEYYFHVPASASGKYHPTYALGEGGLVRHTKAAMGICQELIKASVHVYFPNQYGLSPEEMADACLLALLLHDGLKLGSGEPVADENGKTHTLHEHPLLAASFVRGSLASYLEENDINAYDITIIEAAINAITTHMGRYTVSSRSSTVLPSPASGDWCQKLVHICDLLASRKQLEYFF